MAWRSSRGERTELPGSVSKGPTEGALGGKPRKLRTKGGHASGAASACYTAQLPRDG